MFNPSVGKELDYSAAIGVSPYSERIGRLREDVVSSPLEADIERARYYTESYKETEGQPPCMRAAKALEKTLRQMSIRIEDDDRIVGAKTYKKVACPVGVERTFLDRFFMIGVPFHGKSAKDIAFLDFAGTGSPSWVENLLDAPDEIVNEVKDEIMSYWAGKNLNSQMQARWEKEGLRSRGDQSAMIAAVADMQGHVTIGIKKILDNGFKGIADQAARKLRELTKTEEDDEQKRDFLESVQVAAMAVCKHAERYARLAEEMARKEEGQRRRELLEIADRCRRVPANPPITFLDAVQAIWMSQVVLSISYGEDAIFAPGRVDQYLYPFYERDKDAGWFSQSDCIEILQEYYIKLSTYLGFGPNNLTIGGVGRDGKNATNEISYLMLEAFLRLKAIRNSLAVRISKDAPRDFLLKACEVHQKTAGLAFYNDEIVIRDLMTDGYALEDARDYGVVGCAELTSTGNNNGYTSGSSCLLPFALERAIHALAEPKTFEEVKHAFARQLADAVNMMVKLTDVKDQLFAESFPAPLLSATIEGCIESGRDVTRGGARYNHGTVSAQGIATVANSLAAIEWAVFDNKLIPWKELIGHLRNNFEGAEEQRQLLLRKAPKYGNNDPKADEIAIWVADVLDKESRNHKRPIDGGTYRALMISAGTQTIEGLKLGATPDGRKAGEAVSNGMSPQNGTDTRGATSALHSAAKVCVPRLSAGTVFNMTLNPLSIRSREGIEKFAALIEAYFALGGRQVQFNPMGRETLIDAQKNPNNYPDLMVRVSGYSYRFIDLSKALQNDIIARTEFDI